MTFQEILTELVMGVPVKRKIWRGYWKYDVGANDIKIFTKDGEVINLTNTKDIIYTLASTIGNDWEIATNENCDIKVTEV